MQTNLREGFLYRTVRRHLSTSTRFYPLLATALGNSRLVSAQTDLVIDGFPRSANSYTEAAFEVSQQNLGLNIVSHSHAAAQILESTRREIPTVLLIRNPDDAVASFLENSTSNVCLLYTSDAADE